MAHSSPSPGYQELPPASHSLMDYASTDPDIELDARPLLPQYKATQTQIDLTEDDVDERSSSEMMVGKGKRAGVRLPDDQSEPAWRSRRKSSRARRVFVHLAVALCATLVLLLAAPLVLLWRRGAFAGGIQDALLGVKPDPGAFPTDIGFAGPTPTGSEAALLLTAPSLPLQTAQPPLYAPPAHDKSHGSKRPFNLLQNFGHLSPWYSTEHGLGEASSVQPEGCEIVGLHWLQRHGARYPTNYPSGPAAFADRMKSSKDSWTAKEGLKFLNDWSYELGKEILTPFGRQQLFNLGVSARIKYGFLLDTFEDRLPVFRTESQDRMLKSAQNFAAGFFGIPSEDQYNLEVTIEWEGFNNTLAPYTTCANEQWIAGAGEKLKQWDSVFLKDALKRIQPMIEGYDLTLVDLKDMMETCAYETVALGYSSFCSLFTEREWRGFNYRQDIMWWYSSSFGSPIARAEGLGWAQELVSRLTHTRLTEFNSTTNATLHDDVHFPLNDAIYVDFTHDTTFAQLLPTLNLTAFAADGPPPLDHIPKKRSFQSSRFCPFATNLQFQVLSCSGEQQIRLILNDGVVPLTGLEGCSEDKDGKCPLDTFVSAVTKRLSTIDFARECGLKEVAEMSGETMDGGPVA